MLAEGLIMVIREGEESLYTEGWKILGLTR